MFYILQDAGCLRIGFAQTINAAVCLNLYQFDIILAQFD